MRTIYLLDLVALLYFCKKDPLPAPGPEETEHVLSSAPTDDLPGNQDETPTGISEKDGWIWVLHLERGRFSFIARDGLKERVGGFEKGAGLL
ncbi:hypothetical protein HRG84_13500 [Flavisolibacter sp. BT320]|nr:hypothetical protein [Flavisolibacter longurius]